MLPRTFLRYSSTHSASTVKSEIPSVRWSLLSEKSRNTIYRWAEGAGLISFMGAYFVTHHLHILEPTLLLSFGAGTAGCVYGGLWGYDVIPESKFVDGLRSRQELEQQLLELQKNPLFIAAQNSNDETFSTRIEQINYKSLHPLIDAFEFWVKSDKRLIEMENEAQNLSEQHDQLLPQIPSHFHVPNHRELINDLKSSRLQLNNAIINIKRAPNWIERLINYNQGQAMVAALTSIANNTRKD